MHDGIRFDYVSFVFVQSLKIIHPTFSFFHLSTFSLLKSQRRSPGETASFSDGIVREANLFQRQVGKESILCERFLFGERHLLPKCESNHLRKHKRFRRAA